MKKILGWKRSTGSFVDKTSGQLVEYDNINLYLEISSNSDPLLHGHMCTVEKIKYACSEAVLGVKESDFDSLIGCEVSFDYSGGKYPKLEEVHIIKKG